MPVFNGESTVADAILSIKHQTYTNFKLIISDNASTDKTHDICNRLAFGDPRIEYIRQVRNIGGEANFDEVLRLANTEYFMWAAADDIRSLDYISLCIEFLDSNPDYIAATCPTRYAGESADEIRMGDRTLDNDDKLANVINVFDDTGRLRVNGRFYSIFRRSVITPWLEWPKQYLGSDWALTLMALTHGKFKRLKSGYTELGKHGASKQDDIFFKYRSSWVHWFVPFVQLSRDAWQLIRNGTPIQKIDLLKRLFLLNLRIAKRQVVYEVRRRRTLNNTMPD